MITKISRAENEVIVTYDNRPELHIVSDNGAAWHLAEALLSPRWDMSYSQWLELQDMQDEETQKVA